MNVIASTNELQSGKKSVVTIGTYDGVHEGHRAILKRVLNKAKQNDGQSIVVTFDPHPKEVVGRGKVGLLTTLDERIAIMQELGVDNVLVLKFTYEFSQQTSREFYRNHILPNANVTDVIVGYDHSFGKDRNSNISDLEKLGKEYSFNVEVVSPTSIDNDIVSSTKIRNLLKEGLVDRAALYLGIPYFMKGIVISGDRRGATLGFPTANIKLSSEFKIVPRDGVYCVSAELENNKFIGMMNIGYRPTFQKADEKYLEVNLFDFKSDLYGKNIKINFLKWIREEKVFKTKENLINQLQSDRSECQSYAAASQIL
ncbi:MAG: bifunctional riboflavin kinase/FAD synthetase [Ignavibacteriales bacterium]|nr:bifunctional riboflavin kinase/FAD synthetase [Ignavibacteriales bacterium]